MPNAGIKRVASLTSWKVCSVCAPQPRTVYVPTDRVIESCTNSRGLPCKAVPDAVMAEMLEKLQELQDMKREMKVDKRVAR